MPDLLTINLNKLDTEYSTTNANSSHLISVK
jgi:hypothetical protein